MENSVQKSKYVICLELICHSKIVQIIKISVKKSHFSHETGILLTRIAKSMEAQSEENNELPKQTSKIYERFCKNNWQ